MKVGKVGLNGLVLRQTRYSEFSYYRGPIENVAALAEEHLKTGHQGYRTGVWIVDVPPKGFYSSVVVLKPGDDLIGWFKERKEGEEPRKQLFAKVGSKLPAKSVSLILYHHDVLVAGKEQFTDCEWELVSINARPTVGLEPITPDTLMANHFGASGGTPTNMSSEDFVKSLKTSWQYWKNKALVCEGK